MQNLFIVFLLNQYVNNIGTLYPIRWYSKTESWYRHKDKRNILGVDPRLCFAISTKLTGILLFAFVIFITLKFPGLMEPHYLPILGIILSSLSFALVMDNLTFTNCHEVTSVANWTNNVQIFWRLPKRDKTFIWQTCSILGFGVLEIGILLPIVLVYLNIDPFYLLAKFVLLNNISVKTSSQFLDNFLFQVFRFISTVLASHIGSTSIRTMGLLCYSTGIHRAKLLQLLESWKHPTLSSIRFYRENQIVSNIIRPVDYKMYTLMFCSLFLLFIVFINILVLGVRKDIPVLILLASTLLIFCSVCLKLAFLVGCSFFKSSRIVLGNWRRSLELRIYSAYMKKVLRSLKVIAIPAGEAGIVDVDMKVNYLTNLLLNIVNGIITIQNVIKS